jgi:hypothetical protein
MPPAIVKLVAMILLVVQGAIGLAPGRALCVAVPDCGAHGSGTSQAAFDDCHFHECTEAAGGHHARGYKLGPVVAALHPDNRCRCHLHVPIPRDGWMSRSTQSDKPDVRTSFAPLALWTGLVWVCPSQFVAAPFLHPRDFVATAEVLALKATRLII